MAGAIQYQRIVKYKVSAICTEPLHIGSAVGDREEVLIHPIDDVPFIQATSIAGVFRAYHAKAYQTERTDELFGARRLGDNANSYEYGSKLRFTDGVFMLSDDSKLWLELRPRVSINRESGTGDSNTIKGTDIKSGQKFNMEYIGAGARFEFCVYLYDEDYHEDVEDIFAAIQAENIQFGGQKSNGCGYIKLEELKCKCFDMTVSEDRKQWAQEDVLSDECYENKLIGLRQKSLQQNAYEIIIDGKTENELLVKSIAVADYGLNAPDSMNIRNAKKEYIIPGSSFKGAVRSQMEKIADYLGQPQVIKDTFGYSGTGGESGKAGNVNFYDTVVGNRIENDMAELAYRIHIDKFTGGVIQRGLFSEKNVSGELAFKVAIAEKNNPDKTCGLLLLALRDMAIGTMSIGSGYSVGKGIIAVDRITIKRNRDDAIAVIDFAQNKIENESMITECVALVQTKEG